MSLTLATNGGRRSAGPPPFRDSRKAKRRKINYPAWVLLKSSREPFECVIRDMSDTGAHLVITSLITSLPPRLTLWLDRSGKVQRACEIVWRRADHVGVRFALRDL